MGRPRRYLGTNFLALTILLMLCLSIQPFGATEALQTNSGSKQSAPPIQYNSTAQFQAGTIFDNQSSVLSVDPGARDFAIGTWGHGGEFIAVISSGNNICIYNWSANGLSAIPERISKPGLRDMRSISIGDVNSDGLDDIVVSYSDLAGNGHIAIFNQSATQPFFDSSKVTDCIVDPNPYQVVVGNFDGTSNNSIATVCMGGPQYSDDSIVIWRYPFTGAIDNEIKVQISFSGFPPFTKSKFLAAGDVNGDGRTDLVVGNDSGSNVFIALQPASFHAPWTTYVKAIAGSASDVQLADVNGDGRSDLIFADASSSTVSIYFNTGSGFAMNPSNVPLKASPGLGTVAVGELSDSPGVELLVLSHGYANASLFCQNGQGSFGQYPNLTFPVDEFPLKSIIDRSIAGREGVFILCQGPSGGNGSLLWFNANPTLTGNANANVFAGASSPMALAAGRLANGHEVVAAVLTSSNKLLLYDENNSVSWTVSTQSSPIAAVFGKFGSTSEDDLAVLSAGSHSINLYHGSQLLTSSQPFKNITLPFSNPTCLTTKSLRADGYDDLLIGYGQGCFILYNSEDGQFFNGSVNETVGSTIAGDRTAICVGDFTGGGSSSDIALLNNATNKVEVYPWNAAGSLSNYYPNTPIANLSGLSHPMLSMATGNFGGSTDVAAITSDGQLLLFLRPSYGFRDTTFYPDKTLALGSLPNAIGAGDVNDDGLTDLLIGYNDSPRLAAFLRIGSASFKNAFNFTTGAAPSAVIVQDINGDGRTDIACASPGSHSVSIWFQKNLAPLAKISGPLSQYKGLSVAFSGASSQDSYSDIGSLNYTWHMGDGSIAYGKNVTHRYLQIGSFIVVLNVTDRGGLYNLTSLPIRILQTYPQANFSIWPSLPQEGSWIFFDDTSLPSSISHSPIKSWQWEFDGKSGNITQNARMSFAGGPHTVSLTVLDNDGVKNSTSASFNVTYALPKADFNCSSAKVGNPVYFNSTSWFAWSPIVTYDWNFGDGHATNGTNANVIHTYDMKGRYSVTLKVIDQRGNSTEKSEWIYVNETPPTASLSLVGSAVEGSVATFNLTTFSFNPIVSWNWSYNNNQTWQKYGEASSGETYVFANNGSYWVSVNVTEKDGAWCFTGMRVPVRDTTPRIVNFWTSTGQTCNMDQSVAFWVNATPAYKPITKYEWNFDYPGGSWVDSYPALANHTSWSFDRPKVYHVMVRVWDDDGYVNASYWLEIKDVFPSAYFKCQNSTQTSGEVLFDATLSRDTSSDNSSLNYSWNFGDGSGWTPFSRENKTIPHDFASDGTYTITLIVRDQWGNESNAQTNIAIILGKPLVEMISTGSNATAGEPIVISANVTDQLGGLVVILYYRIGNGNWTEIPMTLLNEPNVYFAQIPAQPENTEIAYKIVASNARNSTFTTQPYSINVEAAPSQISADDLALLAIVIAAILVLIFLYYRAITMVVDDVFIIYDDGNLIAHQTRRLKPGMDDQILASMLVAIQNFVRDSFKDEASFGLNRMDFGEKKILVEKGDRIYLAVVLHGKREGKVPQRMREIVASVEEDYKEALENWDGDLERVRGIKDCAAPLLKGRIKNKPKTKEEAHTKEDSIGTP